MVVGKLDRAERKKDSCPSRFFPISVLPVSCFKLVSLIFAHFHMLTDLSLMPRDTRYKNLFLTSDIYNKYM